METTIWVLGIVVFLALAFDFINGFHDTANAIATSVSTRALTPRRAILLAAVMNFVGAMMFTGVAKTIGGSVTDPTKLDNGIEVVIVTLISAIIWNLVTWWFGIPSSSSHALIGALAGAVFVGAGSDKVKWSGFIDIVGGLLLSPLIAFAIGYVVMIILKYIFAKRSPHNVNKGFRTVQIFTAALQAFTHGTNDAQKAMGIITFALVAAKVQDHLEVPLWVKISAATAMALGTSIGGWKIIKTMGTKIFKIEPINGFAADLSAASVIFTATLLHLPVSTTHAITSAILGVGSAKRFSAVKWGLAGRIIITWFITIPITAALAGLLYWIIF
ncbi:MULTISPECIES: inorganic phosphate transporter [Paenibacillus]|uniref:PiT family inorganic phosphate transporter n=2 Tax=Paenibacillus TaxID=44249 RepID=A0AAP5H530_PAEAM|nr:MULTISPECIES: inorganic phosphate transporter [Paenibacillus]KQY93613.1 inorganic phosphate transporter [Paenibacillus sp. Root52]MCG7377975.1 inorganic phosphate transporter [Paenibacillus sp. ACRSA]MCM3174878.1 inorganic phosphate transporter [Paenibacillus sp. MER 99-2]MDQ0172867.1 PiT family inorganic phosphate transporter [Paenibacillus tundrae]MDR6726012.1 PiT family inorganic phosphate transporter [Paenibacillus amylolyticus]